MIRYLSNIYKYLIKVNYNMFLADKYRPNKFNDYIFNKDIYVELKYLATHENIPHIILSGPPGSGKQTLLKNFLEMLYDDSVNNTHNKIYSVNGSSGKKDVEVTESDYHIVIKPTHTNRDKYMIQSIINSYTSHRIMNIFATNRCFKTVVILNIEILSNNSQAALRRTMEIYAGSCRFVMICNNLSKIFDPLRSRCRTLCIPSPTQNDIENVITNIILRENIMINKTNWNIITSTYNNNVSQAIWTLESLINNYGVIPLYTVFDSIVELIISAPTKNNMIEIFNSDIRNHVYNILITNIGGTEIITIILDKLIDRVQNNDSLCTIIKAASLAEYNLVHGRRDILNIDFFIIAVMKELMINPIK